MTVTLMIGPALFEIAPLSLQKFSLSRKYPFASHDVMGAEPVLEDMGPENASITVEGCLKPEHFGGLGELEALKTARDAAIPLPVVRGDFTPLGFFVIEEVEEKHETINEFGIGREIEVEVKLKSCASPGIGMAASILRLFG